MPRLDVNRQDRVVCLNFFSRHYRGLLKAASLAMALFFQTLRLSNCVQPVCRIQRFLQKRFSSSKRWQARQLKDHYTREAAVQGLKSRAAFKLLQVISY